MENIASNKLAVAKAPFCGAAAVSGTKRPSDNVVDTKSSVCVKDKTVNPCVDSFTTVERIVPTEDEKTTKGRKVPDFERKKTMNKAINSPSDNYSAKVYKEQCDNCVQQQQQCWSPPCKGERRFCDECLQSHLDKAHQCSKCFKTVSDLSTCWMHPCKGEIFCPSCLYFHNAATENANEPAKVHFDIKCDECALPITELYSCQANKCEGKRTFCRRCLKLHREEMHQCLTCRNSCINTENDGWKCFHRMCIAMGLVCSECKTLHKQQCQHSLKTKVKPLLWERVVREKLPLEKRVPTKCSSCNNFGFQKECLNAPCNGAIYFCPLCLCGHKDVVHGFDEAYDDYDFGNDSSSMKKKKRMEARACAYDLRTAMQARGYAYILGTQQELVDEDEAVFFMEKGNCAKCNEKCYARHCQNAPCGGELKYCSYCMHKHLTDSHKKPDDEGAYKIKKKTSKAPKEEARSDISECVCIGKCPDCKRQDAVSHRSFQNLKANQAKMTATITGLFAKVNHHCLQKNERTKNSVERSRRT